MTNPITVDKRKLINALMPLLKDSATLKELVANGSNTWDDTYFSGLVYEAGQQVSGADMVDDMEELLKEIMIDD